MSRACRIARGKRAPASWVRSKLRKLALGRVALKYFRGARLQVGYLGGTNIHQMWVAHFPVAHIRVANIRVADIRVAHIRVANFRLADLRLSLADTRVRELAERWPKVVTANGAPAALPE